MFVFDIQAFDNELGVRYLQNNKSVSLFRLEYVYIHNIVTYVMLCGANSLTYVTCFICDPRFLLLMHMYHCYIFNMKKDIEVLQKRHADNYGGTKKTMSLDVYCTNTLTDA
jgi:hypothetical protein